MPNYSSNNASVWNVSREVFAALAVKMIVCQEFPSHRFTWFHFLDTSLWRLKRKCLQGSCLEVQAISAGIWAHPWQPHFDCAKWPVASCAWTCNLPECSRYRREHLSTAQSWVRWVTRCNKSFPSSLFSPVLLPSQFGLMRRAAQILEVLPWFLWDERLRRWKGWETCKRCLQNVNSEVSTEHAKSKGNKHLSFITAPEVQGAQGSSVKNVLRCALDRVSREMISQQTGAACLVMLVCAGLGEDHTLPNPLCRRGCLP